MEISKQTIQTISNVIKVAKILKIEHLIIDNECVRGHNIDEGLMIIEHNLPKFEFSVLGISRVDILNTRLNLLGDAIVVEAEEKEISPTSKIVSKLIISSGKTEIEFKCANPTILSQGKQHMKDPVYFTFNISQDSISLLSKAQSAFKGETIALVGSSSGIVAKCNDAEGDMMNHLVTEEIIQSRDEMEKRLDDRCETRGLTTEEQRQKSIDSMYKFYFSYKNKVLLSLLKDAIVDDSVQVNITRRGILNLKVLDINVYISPEL